MFVHVQRQCLLTVGSTWLLPWSNFAMLWGTGHPLFHLTIWGYHHILLKLVRQLCFTGLGPWKGLPNHVCSVKPRDESVLMDSDEVGPATSFGVTPEDASHTTGVFEWWFWWFQYVSIGFPPSYTISFSDLWFPHSRLMLAPQWPVFLR